MKKRMKRSTKQCIWVGLLCILLVGGAATAAYVLMTSQIKATYEEKIAAQEAEIEENKRTVYVAIQDIPVGDCISGENTERKEAYSCQPQENYLTGEELGRTALIDIPAGTHVMKTMVTDLQVSEDLREVLYSVIKINPNILNNEAVDVRLLYPNGENYIVLSKKNIKNMEEGAQNCYLWLDEEEILLMSSAMVDAYLYEGSTLYTAKYIEPNLQEASIATYVPSEQTMELIRKDPNIVEIASHYLEEKLREELELRMEAVLPEEGTATGNKYIDGTVNLDPVIKEPEDTTAGNSNTNGYFE